jgi:membrane-bound ClpP family serine protease
VVAAAVAGCSLLLYTGPLQARQHDRIAYSLEVSGTIDPATDRWLGHALEDAEQAGASLAKPRQ